MNPTTIDSVDIVLARARRNVAMADGVRRRARNRREDLADLAAMLWRGAAGVLFLAAAYVLWCCAATYF